MTSPTTGMPLLPTDTAWRQWKTAVKDHAALKAREETDPLRDGYKRDTDKAAANLAQARAVWLQTMLGHFERRRLDMADNGKPASTDRELKALGLPCADCLNVIGENNRTHKVNKDESKLFPVWATCGGEAIDPLTSEMPTW